MRYFRILVWIGLVSIIFISCKKQQEVLVVSGKMIDPKMEITLEGVKVELWAQKIESGIYSAHFDSYGSQLSNSNGEFSFDMPNQTYASVKLSFSKENYYSWEYEIDGDVIKTDFLHNETYQMQAKAWISISIINENPVDGNDYFDFRIMNGFTSCENCCLGETMKYYGTQINEEFICQLIGHEDVGVRWSSRKGSIQKGDVELIFIPSFDTTKVEFVF